MSTLSPKGWMRVTVEGNAFYFARVALRAVGTSQAQDVQTGEDTYQRIPARTMITLSDVGTLPVEETVEEVLAAFEGRTPPAPVESETSVHSGLQPMSMDVVRGDEN
jgi:hypothetical protein